MAPLELDGETLGKKHENYNKLVREASKNEILEPSQDDDIRNLLNIDIASNNRNVDYILGVLKSEDELYVSKAIKRSTWLITDPQYVNIINPEYLYKEIHPQMTTKAFKKLMLQIRLHLKDEKRVEAFYNIVEEKEGNSAFKWLQHCSVPFLEAVVEKYSSDIPDHLALRLFEKSFRIFEAYHKKMTWKITVSPFILKNCTNEYLDFIEAKKDRFYDNFNAKDTNLLMQKCPQRIMDKIDFYGKYLDSATFAKYLKKKDDIKEFLLKHQNNDKCKWLFTYNNMKHFIMLLPKENRFEFVKKLFIDKGTSISSDGEFEPYECQEDEPFHGQVMLCSAKCDIPQNTKAIYKWYKFAPFEIALPELKKLIRTESAPDQRSLILQVLLTCAGRNMQNIKAVLQYYYDKHINEPFKFKINFVNHFISKVETHSVDDQVWGLLNQLFHSMEVYIESENNVQNCVKAIIVRNVIRNEPVPDIVTKKFEFDTLSTYNKKLKKQEEKDTVFKYLQDFITMKRKSLNLTIETEFNESVKCCEQLLTLIKDWGKELHDYPKAISEIKELINIKRVNQWSRDFSALYNIKKSWRKILFEESIALMQNEAVCINALKHDPELLSRNKEQLMVMCFNDALSLRSLLRKMRIYWARTLSAHWETEYLKHLNETSGHKATINGLCTLLSTKKINELLNKYAPSDTKINWNETDQLELSLRKQIAKNIYKARPLPPVDGILLYAKGDYLQFAVPSVDSTLSQLSPNKSRLYVPKLLDAPVSLQKFGVRCAFQKLSFEELKPMLYDNWNSTKNTTIRTVLFTHTLDMLCKEKNDSIVKVMWDLLSMFIETLTSDENKLVYIKLGDVDKVPNSIKPQLFMKSYTFLSSLPAKCRCENILDRMRSKEDDFMDRLDNDFVVNIMLKNFSETLSKKEYIYENANTIAKFILASKDEEMQLKRYEMSLAPVLDRYLPEWDQIAFDSEGRNGKYRVKSHLKQILDNLVNSLPLTFEKKMQVPVKTFESIQIALEKSLCYKKDYVLLTSWKIVVNFVKLVAETEIIQSYYKIEAIDLDKDNSDSNDEKSKMFSEINSIIRPKFSKILVQYFKEDMERFGNTIYLLFAPALCKVLYEYLTSFICKMEEALEYGIWLLRNENDKYVWLMVHQFFKEKIYNIYDDTEKKKFEEVREIVFSSSCPADEVKMLFYDMFSDRAPYTPSTS